MTMNCPLIGVLPLLKAVVLGFQLRNSRRFKRLVQALRVGGLLTNLSLQRSA